VLKAAAASLQLAAQSNDEWVGGRVPQALGLQEGTNSEKPVTSHQQLPILVPCPPVKCPQQKQARQMQSSGSRRRQVFYRRRDEDDSDDQEDAGCVCGTLQLAKRSTLPVLPRWCRCRHAACGTAGLQRCVPLRCIAVWYWHERTCILMMQHN
jgi:hypothetical protein